MREPSNFDIELGEYMEVREREAAIARAQSRLKPAAELECIDCEELINPERKRKHPAARRCIRCQSLHERQTRRGM